MFYLYHHNDLARLADLFAALRLRRTVSPLAQDTVLAPNAGIGRWLRIQLAESEGIAANIDGDLPGEFIWRLLGATLPEADEAGHHFQADCLPWHLYTALPEIAREVPEVAAYLGEPVAEVRRYQLARQLADVFDEYLYYRADMLARWEAGEIPATAPGRWQARVWHWLTRAHRLGSDHRATALRRFITRLTDPSDTAFHEHVIAHCPADLYCFGLVALPPDHLRFLYALAAHIDVHFLLPNPSEAYWGDITAGRVALDLPTPETTDDAAHLLPGEAAVEAGHPLLSGLGRMARDTLRLLYADEFAGMIEPELGEVMAYERPADDSLLHRIQADIVTLDCTHSGQGMARDDVSFEVHACHSRLREVQVLQDQLLDRLARDDARVAAGDIAAGDRLAPKDIIVMLPDVAAYTPAIQAVFGGAPADRYLPFGLADRARSAAHPIVGCVADLLDLPLSRWRASELLDLLAVPAVARRFRLDATELTRLAEWIDAAGIRWGRDGPHRAALGAGDYDQNSWRFGLDRLLLGVAQSDDETLTDGVAPWADLEGGAAAALGKLWRFEDTLRQFADALDRAATPGEWQTRLNRLLDAVIAVAPDEADEQRAVDALRQAFAGLDRAEACTRDKPLSADRTLSWEAVRDDLRARLSAVADRQPFLAGGITFCGMVPLRAVPFRMVCLLGMDDTAFPRQDTGRAFNVMFTAPRLGDRNIRDDDRLLFLQALTAARDLFYISYIGQDIRTGEALPPSPLVGETLDFIHRTYFAAHSRADFDNRLIHRQPMQPFSARYFTAPAADSDPRIFTYAGDWQAGSLAAHGARRIPASFMDDAEADEPDDLDTIDLASLKRFFDHPSRAFFRDRLHLDIEHAEAPIADEEPLDLSPLAAAGLRRRLLASAEAAHFEALAETPSPLEIARGSLPPPPLAASAFASQAAAVNQLLPLARAWRESADPESRDIALSDIAGLRLTGRVAGVYDDTLRRLVPSKLKTRHRLRAWIDYLALAAGGQATHLTLAGYAPDNKDLSAVCYEACIAADTARQVLAELVALYRTGQRRPLTFHPDLADAYNPDQNKAFENLSFRFRAGDYREHHLMHDVYFRLLLGPAEAPLGEAAETSPFIAQIDSVTATMNDALVAYSLEPADSSEAVS
ncbi:exodeoxyribonuclease V subunit gamma [uncultured Salinisphaera sp.]|uniref:exodeoxyribonuclease V subunit gamma n=1 Tax=uncultured Salinisphaera sp. TaxID=359372 RepID=UPI0032B2DFA2